MNHTTEKTGGLAIAGFATAAGGALISLTGIGAFIGIPAIIVGLVLAIVALIKKQKYRGLSIAAIAISVLALIGGIIAMTKMKQLATPLIQSGQEIESLIENDPELKELMKDEAFNEAFQANLKKRMEAREAELKTKGENGDIQGMMAELGTMISEETKAAIQETKEQFKK